MGSMVVLCSSNLVCGRCVAKRKVMYIFDFLIFVSLALKWVFWLRVKDTEFNRFSAQRILNCEI